MAHPSSILSVCQFPREALEDIFSEAQTMAAYLREGGGPALLRDRLLATHFAEPSLRTKLSFEAAHIRLGGQILGGSATEGERAFSAILESLQDTARVMSSYADVIIVRNPAPSAVQLFAENSDVPIINAGSGQGPGSEHPTQALLDLYTIHRERETLDGLRLLIVGSTTKRAARSLLLALAMFDDVEVRIFAPKSSWVPIEDERYLKERGVRLVRVDDPAAEYAKVDVIYHSGQAADCQAQLPEAFTLTAAALRKSGTRALVLHPLPRPGSISYDVDALPNARYFQAAHNGLAVRMVLLARLFSAELSRRIRVREQPLFVS
jgi:aspartate carbamoyltransferase catalytic subunit